MKTLAALMLMSSGCYPGGLQPLPVATPARPCMVWGCTDDWECRLLTCEQAIPLMERRLCELQGKCVQT